MPLIQESNKQKMTPDFIASMKTQSLTQKNDKSNWTLTKALATGIISSLGLAYFTYNYYGQKNLPTPLIPPANPIRSALKVLLPTSIVISSLYYCFKNNNYQKSLSKSFDKNIQPDLTNHSKYYQRPQNQIPSYYYQNPNENLNHPIHTTSSPQTQDSGPIDLEFPLNIIPFPLNPYPSHNSSLGPISSLEDFEIFFYDICKKFEEEKEITKDIIEAIKTALIYLEKNPVFPSREKMLNRLLISVMTLLIVKKNHTEAAELLWHVYDKFLTIDENRALDIATYCIFVNKSSDDSINNDLINTCEKIVECTKKCEKLFISLAVKCSERADISPPHNNVVIEFLNKYKEVGDAIVSYMIGCSKLDHSYAQEKIVSLHTNHGTPLPLLNSCIDNLFGKNKSQPLVGNKSVIFDFFERRIHLIKCSENLSPKIQKIIESYKTAYKIEEIDKFISMLIEITDIDIKDKQYNSNIEFADAFTLLNIIFEYYKLSNDKEKMQMLHEKCCGHFALTMLKMNIEDALNSFNPNLNQLDQRLLLKK